jgi:hypothetical protein
MPFRLPHYRFRKRDALAGVESKAHFRSDRQCMIRTNKYVFGTFVYVCGAAIFSQVIDGMAGDSAQLRISDIPWLIS